MPTTSILSSEACKLQNNKYSGVRTIEILSVPRHENLEKNDVYYKQSNIFLDLLGELYRVCPKEDAYFDIVWISERVQGQTYKARIRFFLVIRCIKATTDIIAKTLIVLESIISNVLTSNSYTYKVVDVENENLAGLFKNISGNGYSIIKKDIITNTPLILTEFYYSIDIFPPNISNNMDGLISTLIEYPNTAILFQLSPTNYSLEEKHSIRTVTHLMKKFSRGYYDDYYGEIRDEFAAIPAEIFQTYHDKIDSPLFEFNITLFASDIDSIPLLSKLSSCLHGNSEEKDVRVEYVKLPSAIRFKEDYYTLPWNIYSATEHYRSNLPFWLYEDSPQSLKRFSRIISIEEAASFFKLPLGLNENIMGVNTDKYGNIKETFEEGVFSEDNIVFGELVGSNSKKHKIGVSENELIKHMFVSGAARSGKTTFILNILKQLDEKKIPFLVLEMVKSEYRPLIDAIDNVNIFTPGKHKVSPFIINPFIPPKNVELIQYKSYLMTAFRAAINMSGPLQALFIEAIDRCYTKYGWRDSSTSADPQAKSFGMMEFIQVFKLCMKMKKYSTEIKNNIEQAGVVRLMNLINQNYTTFDNKNTMPIDEILCQNTIIELEAIGDTEQKALIASLIIVNVISYIRANMSLERYGKLNNLFVLEEAHVLLEPRKSITEIENSSIVATELINSILAEMPAYGFGMVVSDQSPQKVPVNVIINTGIKIALRTNEAQDKDTLAHSMNLNDEDKEKLSTFKNGLGYCFFDKLTKPQIFQAPNIFDNNKLKKIVIDSEISERNKFWQKNSGLLIPYNECAFINVCDNSCCHEIRIESRHISQSIVFDELMQNVESITKKKIAYLLSNFRGQMEKYISANFDYMYDCRFTPCSILHFFRELEINNINHIAGISQKEVESFLKNYIIRSKS